MDNLRKYTKSIKVKRFVRLNERRTESRQLVAQQVLNTYSVRINIYQQVDLGQVQTNGIEAENVTSVCRTQAQKEYKSQHDELASHLCWCLCRKV